VSNLIFRYLITKELNTKMSSMFIRIKTSLAQDKIRDSTILRLNLAVAHNLRRPVGYCSVSFLTGDKLNSLYNHSFLVLVIFNALIRYN
jgi:hypothetical protein